VPPLLLAVVSSAAGKAHKLGGDVAGNLAQVLNAYDELAHQLPGDAPCAHPTQELEVWPDGSGTYCWWCGGKVDWAKDEETKQ
jgi:hypothetical protein